MNNIFTLFNFYMFTFLVQTLKSGKFIGKINTKQFLRKHPTQDINQNIIVNKHKSVYNEQNMNLYLNNNSFITDKNIISISPCGIKGFYLMGILNYIKQNYDLKNYIFSGASAGAWNGLFMSFNKNPNDFVYKMLSSDLKKAKSINELEYTIKYKILKQFTEDDFELDRLFIGVTTMRNYRFQTSIFSDFDNLEDAINCCIASSHIPLITGGISNRYHDMYTFDGGFSTYPYLNLTKSVLHVSPNIWNDYDLNSNAKENNKLKNKFKGIIRSGDFLFINKNVNFIELYDNGYADAKKNKQILDKIFHDFGQHNI